MTLNEFIQEMGWEHISNVDKWLIQMQGIEDVTDLPKVMLDEMRMTFVFNKSAFELHGIERCVSPTGEVSTNHNLVFVGDYRIYDDGVTVHTSGQTLRFSMDLDVETNIKTITWSPI